MGTTFLKRQKEMKRLEKQRGKAERREQKKLAERAQRDALAKNNGSAVSDSPAETEEVPSGASSPA